LIRDHKADIDRERIHVDEKHQEVLRLMRDRDEYMQTISDDLDDAINATADFITFGVCLPLSFVDVWLTIPGRDWFRPH